MWPSDDRSKELSVTTTIRVPVWLLEKKKEQGFSWIDLVLRGYQHRESFPAMIDRVQRCEEAIVRLQHRLTTTGEENAALRAQLDAILKRTVEG